MQNVVLTYPLLFFKTGSFGQMVGKLKKIEGVRYYSRLNLLAFGVAFLYYDMSKGGKRRMQQKMRKHLVFDIHYGCILGFI